MLLFYQMFFGRPHRAGGLFCLRNDLHCWRMRCRLLSCLLAILPVFSFCTTPSGIPRELAQERARLISDLHYRLQFTLVPHASTTAGHEDLTFRLQSAAPLLIDYREGTVHKLLINDRDTPIQAENGHILLPQEKLRGGENHIAFDFESPVAPAGKAITRYEDKDDGSEYIYTLFVPMDASMAFPCFDQPDIKARFRLQLDVPDDWLAISNGSRTKISQTGGRWHWWFEETRPISTYLFAFAVGPVRS